MPDTSSPSSLNSLRIDRSAPAVPRRRPWGWMAAGAVVVIAGAGWWLAPKPIPVQTTAVVTATASQQHALLTASGYVVAQRRASVASKATGRLVALNVREGSVVREGDQPQARPGADAGYAACQAASTQTPAAGNVGASRADV